MAISDLLNAHRITGALLILAFIIFGIGGTLPVVGPKGNFGIFTLPVQEHLSAVAGNSTVWWWANVFMGTAAVILMAGLTIFTTLLEGAGERAFSRLGLVGILFSVVLWVIFSAFRAIVTIRAAQEMAATGTAPAYYQPLAQWAFALFFIYAVVGFLALTAYGGSLLLVDLMPTWIGWATIVFNLAMLLLLLINGDSLPAFHYFSPLILGIILLIRG